MEQPEVLKKAIKTILQEGVDFSVNVAHLSLLHRMGLLKKTKTFVIYPLCFGTIFKISEILLDVDLGEITDEKTVTEVGIQNIVKYKDKLIDVLTLAIHNRKTKPPKRLARFLDNNLNMIEALRIFEVVRQQMGLDDFLALTVSVTGLNVMETASTPGELSEASKNTSDTHKTKSSGTSVGQT